MALASGGRDRGGRFRHVVVGVDFTDRSLTALDRARQLAEEHTAQVHAVHVADRSTPTELLDTARARLAESVGGGHTITVVCGSAPAELVAEAERRDADLIVLGAHGEHPIRDVLLGSTAESVVHASKVPVLIVKHPGVRRYTSVLLAVDEHDSSFQAARTGMALAPTARHTLVHVVAVVGETLLRLHGASEAAIEALRAAHVSVFLPKVEPQRKRCLPADTPAVTPVTGLPQVMVSDMARSMDCDLVVTGSSGASRLRGIVVGSVAQNTMRRTGCDVLIVPERSRHGVQ